MTINIPQILGHGRLDTLLHILSLLRSPDTPTLRLNWTRTREIAPAGFAILACIFDTAVEHAVKVENLYVKKRLKDFPVVQNLLRTREFPKLLKPTIHDMDTTYALLSGNETSINPAFPERVQERFATELSEDLGFGCRLILNELMQNSVDHSTSERYYMYAGTWGARGSRELHFGVLDLGITIPAKLEQKYSCPDDRTYLDLALKEGTTTRRQRPGGMGLHFLFEHLKSSGGTLAILSRDAEVIRYFRNKRVVRQRLKNRLTGTWCLARFPLEAR